MTADLTKLAERVERLEAPCRKTDEEIALALGWERIDPPDEVVSITFWRLPDGNYEDRVPDWTASIDAVVALVREKLPGWSGELDIGAPWVAGMPPSGARLFGPPPKHFDTAGEAATPARALLAATLRALTEKNDDGG